MRILVSFAIAFSICCGVGRVDVQSLPGTPQVGVLVSIPMEQLSGPTPADTWARVFRNSMAEGGWTDGKNMAIVWKSALTGESIPVAIEELVSMLVISQTSISSPWS